jgi:hypothetical protein
MRWRATGTRYVWLVCGTAVLALNILGALVSGRWGLDQAAIRAIAVILYFCAGVGGGRIAGVRAGALAGAATALVDETLGRAIFGALSAGPTVHAPGVIGTAVVALGVIFTGLGVGLVGGALGKVVHSRLADLADS